jgi:hypothetical protein
MIDRARHAVGTVRGYQSARLFSVSIRTATAHSGFMDTAMNYALWSIAALMISGFVLAVLVW